MKAMIWTVPMSGDLLQTKLYVPRLRPSLVPRPHLIEKLNQGLHSKLSLISAPAGFGKTTLVSEWIAGGERPFAWLSCHPVPGRRRGIWRPFSCAGAETDQPLICRSGGCADDGRYCLARSA